MKDQKKESSFIEREWNEETEGEYDEDGFFVTPNGSFWDPDGVYFNKKGLDKHGGYYDDNGVYMPGKGWDKDNNCYESEKEDDYDEYYNDDEFHGEHIKNEFDLKEVNDLDVLDEDVFEGDILDPNDPNIEQIIQESKSDMKTNEKEKKEKEDADKK